MIEPHGGERHARADEDDVGLPAQLEQPRERLVGHGAAGDADAVLAPEEVLAGLVRQVAGRRTPLEDRECALLAERLQVREAADHGDVAAGETGRETLEQRHPALAHERSAEQALHPVASVEPGVDRAERQAGVEHVPARDVLRQPAHLGAVQPPTKLRLVDAVVQSERQPGLTPALDQGPDEPGDA